MWKWEHDGDGDLTKILYTTLGRRAKTSDPRTWINYEHARLTWLQRPLDFDGLGFVTDTSDAFCGIDLDHCRDPDLGVLDPWALKVVTAFNSYSEVTPSGTGVRIWLRGKLPDDCKHKIRVPDSPTGQAEVYDYRRFFTVTGQHLAASPLGIEPRQVELEQLVTKWFTRPPRPERPTNGNGATLPTLSDSEIVNRIQNDPRFALLWQGDTSAYASGSEADFALITKLAYWTGDDPERIEQLMYCSGLVRNKWDSRRGQLTLLQHSIERAIETRSHDSAGIDLDLAVELSSNGTGKQQDAAMPLRSAYDVCHEDAPPIRQVALYCPTGTAMALIGRAKWAGKTTYLLHLGRHVTTEQPWLGQSTIGGPVVYYTEQAPQTFRDQLKRAGLEDNRDFYIRFRHELMGMGWPQIVAQGFEEAGDLKAVLLIFDTVPTLASIPPDKINDPGFAHQTMAPIAIRMPQHPNLSVIPTRHANKSDTASYVGAWEAEIDGFVVIRRLWRNGHSYEQMADDGRRNLNYQGRLEQPPAELTIKLEDGTYVPLSYVDDADEHEQQGRRRSESDSGITSKGNQVDAVLHLDPNHRATPQQVADMLGKDRTTWLRYFQDHPEKYTDVKIGRQVYWTRLEDAGSQLSLNYSDED